MENEIWKDVKGYEGYYQVSNMGRVKSMRVLKTPKNGVKCRKNAFLSTKTSHDKQYVTVALCRDGEKKQTQVHRLVAEAFIPNPNNLPFVNHKDENPGNNRADNLEWCTNEYNIAYGTAPARHGKTLSENYRKKATSEDEARMVRLIERRGQITAYREKDNSWFGPFNSLEEARLALKITKFDRIRRKRK